MLAGFCGTRNFDLGMGTHANGEGARRLGEDPWPPRVAWAGSGVLAAPAETVAEIKLRLAWHGRIVFLD